jgi:hypothetical protein
MPVNVEAEAKRQHKPISGCCKNHNPWRVFRAREIVWK